MRVYSPSQTKAWLTCPVLRQLSNVERWRPRLAGKKELGGILGTAMHAGLAVYHLSLKEGTADAQQHSVAAGIASVRHELAKLSELGVVVRPEDQAQAGAIENRVKVGITRYINAAPIPTTWVIDGVEVNLGDRFGNCRLDLAVAGPLGAAVADLKVRLTLAPQYRQREIERYRTDWQFRHYVWAYSQFTGLPVHEYFVILVVLEPFKVEVIPFVVGPEDMAVWEGSAQTVWYRMEEEGDGSVSLPYQNLTNCVTNFGPCEMYRACHDCHYDEQLMSRDYVRVPR